MSDMFGDNPCARCTVNQDCCSHLSGLRLTQIEFDRCFRHHLDKLRVEYEGPVVVVAPKDGGACPNWQNGGCAVYDTRPRECTLFPFTLFLRRPKDGLVSIGYHSDTLCPFKAELLPSPEQAENLIADFGQEAFPKNRVEVEKERMGERWTRLARFVLYRVRRLFSG